MTALYIIAGVCLWILIGSITFRILDAWYGDDKHWNNPLPGYIGRENHAKMGFWLGPMYTATVLLLFLCEGIGFVYRLVGSTKLFRKVMGL